MDKVWPVQEAKARFSELLEKCIAEGPQTVSKRGVETAVLVSVKQWKRMKRQARPSLKQWLLSPAARTETLAPPRGKLHGRRPLKFS